MFTSIKGRLLGGSAIVLAVAVALGLTVTPVLDDETTDEAPASQIGVYDPEMIFQQYHGINELIAMSQRLQQEAQQAQMEGNQQRLMEIQQEMQAAQMRIINQFQNDIERIVPEVARENDLKLVGVELTYVASELGEPRDISEAIIAKLNEEAPDAGELGARDPFAPGPAPGSSPDPGSNQDQSPQ